MKQLESAMYMHAHTQLSLLKSLQRRSNQSNAFTLIELMIVEAIVGLLAAVAIPKYLEARNNAAAIATIGEQLGLAKECATWVASQVGATPSGSCSTNVGS